MSAGKECQDNDMELANPQEKETWGSTLSKGWNVVSDAVTGKPPKEEDMGFLRRSTVLATLCIQVYDYKENDVGSTSYIPLQVGGIQGDGIAVGAQLLYFREATDNGEVNGPQQYGIWKVSRGVAVPQEDFIAIVFRGTWSTEDVVIDVNIRPTPLNPDLQESGLCIHQGFSNGATEHVDEIVEALREIDRTAGRKLPVWVAGHSLGGAYANALILHLLQSKRTKELFETGGGSCTFGAPMVVHSVETAQAYEQLKALEPELDEGCTLSFHNYVNNADPVPRLLGSSLDQVHGWLETWVPKIKAVRETASQYHPFGQYHIIIGAEIRSVKLPGNSEQSSSRLGNAEYAAEVNRQLDLSYMWRNISGTTGRGGGWTPHEMRSYQERLATHMDALIVMQSEICLATGKSITPQAETIFTSSTEDPTSVDAARTNAAVGRLAQAGAGAIGRALWARWKG